MYSPTALSFYGGTSKRIVCGMTNEGENINAKPIAAQINSV
jgi:hypothetical protein